MNSRKSNSSPNAPQSRRKSSETTSRRFNGESVSSEKQPSNAFNRHSPPLASKKNAQKIDSIGKKSSWFSVTYSAWFSLGSTLAFVLFTYWFWACRYGELLRTSQYYDLFFWKPCYFDQYYSQIGGFLSCFASFWVQFFYHPWLGALVLTLTLLLIQRLLVKQYRLRGSAVLLSFLPPLLLMTSVGQVNYYLFEMINVKFLFGNFFALLFLLVVSVKIDQIAPGPRRFWLEIAAIFCLYPLLGAYAILLGLTFLLKSVAFPSSVSSPSRIASKNIVSADTSAGLSTPKSLKMLPFELIVLAILATPLFWYAVLYRWTVPFRELYYSGLIEPDAFIKKSFFTLPFYTLYWGAFAIVLGLSAVDIFRQRHPSEPSVPAPSTGTSTTTSSKNTSAGSSSWDLAVEPASVDASSLNSSPGKNGSNVTDPPSAATSNQLQNLHKIRAFANLSQRPTRSDWLGWALLGILFFLTVHFSLMTPVFSETLRMGGLLDKQDWEAILHAERRVPTPSIPLILTRYLALEELNALGDRMFERPYIDVNDLQTRFNFVRMFGDRLLYHYGCVNVTNRLSMNIFTNKREQSVWTIKTLTLCALANDETVLARRYLNILSRTTFYRPWAKRYERYLEHREGQEPLTENLLSCQREQERIREKMCNIDTITTSTNLDAMIRQHYDRLDSQKCTPRQKIDQMMFLLIWSDMPRFFDRLHAYLESNPETPLPRHLQEMLLYEARIINKESIDTVSPYISPEVMERFLAFFELYKKTRTSSQHESILQLNRDFSDTAWHFMLFNDKIR